MKKLEIRNDDKLCASETRRWRDGLDKTVGFMTYLISAMDALHDTCWHVSVRTFLYVIEVC